MNVHVKNGTNAGRRKPFEGRAPDWFCRCTTGAPETFKKQNGHLKRCIDCGAERPT